MRRHAKASSAGSQRQAVGLGRFAQAAAAARARSLGASGSGAPAARRLTLFTLTALAFLAIPAAQALANGNVNLTVAGLGTGQVGSVSQTIFFGTPIGPATATPGEINCDKSGGPICAMSAAASAGTETRVSLTATADPEMEFLGWQQTGATSVVSGCTTGASCVINLNGSPGPASTITATFGCVTPISPPDAASGGASAGEDPLTRTLEGTVNPNGCGLEETYFEYGTTTEYGSTTATKPAAAGLGAGHATVPVSAETDFLEPNTTYHYRLAAVGPGGTVTGEDQEFTTGSAPPDGCPNALLRAEQGTAVQHLPDCMALEMVSPIQKDGQAAKFPDVSLDGSRVSFASEAALGENPQPSLNIQGSIYVASRGGSDWATQRTQPAVSLFKLWGPVSNEPPAGVFTPDFSRSLQMGATLPQAERGIIQAYDAGLGGSFTPFSAPLVPLTSDAGQTTGRESIVTSNEFAGASADHSDLYFIPGRGGTQPTTYLPGDPQTDNTYLARLGADGRPAGLELLQRDASGKVWGGQCGARLGGIGAATNSSLPAPNGKRNQGAISADGARTYLSAPAAQPQTGSCLASSKLRILERLETPSGPQISELFGDECTRVSPPCSNADGDDLYQGASLNQDKVYFTTNRQLANSDLDGFPFTGTGTTAANSTTVSAVVTATGTGTLTSGSKQVTGLSTASGSFLVGQTISGTGIPANTLVAALGSGTLELSKAATASGAPSLSAGPQPFAVGQTISGAGIAPGTTITAVNVTAQTLTLSAAATASASGVALSTNEECNLHVTAAGCDLYLYDSTRPAGQRLVQVSAGEELGPGVHEKGKEAKVYNGITAISADGSRAYFVATGVLTSDANPEGEVAEEGKPNLYVFDLQAWEAAGEEGGLNFLGTLAAGDEIKFSPSFDEGLWGGQGTWKNDAYPVPALSAAERRGEGDAEEGGDGHVLVFETHASLTANDRDGGHLDAYRYDSDAGTLECVSCAPGSSAAAPDEAPFDVGERGATRPLGTNFAEYQRWVSEDGEEVVFATAERLLPGDNNGAADAYLWREGHLYRLPGSGTAGESASARGKPALSPDGTTVAFVTPSRLLPQDGDGVADVYVARADGGFPPPPPPLICQGEECRGAPSAVPQLGGAGTAVLQSAGNVKQQQSCKKGRVRRNGRCVAKRKHRARKTRHGHKAHKRRQIRQADTDRRASR